MCFQTDIYVYLRVRPWGTPDPLQSGAASGGPDQAAGHLHPLPSLPRPHPEAAAADKVRSDLWHLCTRYVVINTDGAPKCWCWVHRMNYYFFTNLCVSCCFSEAVQASERQDKNWLLINSCSSKQTLGIRLKSIQNVIEQVMKSFPSTILMHFKQNTNQFTFVSCFRTNTVCWSWVCPMWKA